MRLYKAVLLVVLCLGFFFYGMISIEYKYFPYSYIMSVKQYVTHTQDQRQSTETLNTFFRRLLVKKVYIDKNLFRGGGLASTDPYIFIVTSKGKLLVFNKENYSKVQVNADEVPMNYNELLGSDYPTQEDFRIDFFRVSGIYTERVDQNIFRLFVTHHTFDEENACVQHNISKIDLRSTNGSLVSVQPWQTFFSAKPCIELNPEHYVTVEPFVGHEGGGKIIEHNDSTLMVSVGEYGRNGLNKTERVSLDPSVPYGKIILVDKVTGEWSVYAMGLRNPLGLYRDSNGVIWETENGPRAGDELNIIEEGQNYGWPNVSYGVWYDDSFELDSDTPRGTHSGYKEPVYAWMPAIAPNNLTRIEGDKFDTWKGDLIIGSMTGKSLHRMRLSEDNRVVYAERIELGHRVRDLITLSDDSIALITDDGFLIVIDDGGSIFEEMDAETVERRNAMNKYNGFSAGKADNQIASTEPKTSKMIFDQNCASCHSLAPKGSVGPHLHNLFQREVGNIEDFNYSSTMQNDDRMWSPSLLESYLLNPETEFPNSQMPKINLTATEVDSIISYLKKSDM